MRTCRFPTGGGGEEGEKSKGWVFAEGPAGLWNFVAKVLVFVISPAAINTLIGFKAVPQF